MHETPREFFIRHYAFAKMIAIQMLCSSHHFVWLSAIVLQICPLGISPQSPWQNGKKGSHMNPWSVQNLPNGRN